MLTFLLSRTRYSCQSLRKLEFYGQIFRKSSNMKFQENRSHENGVVPCVQTDGRTLTQTDVRRDRGTAERQTDMTNSVVTFHNFFERAEIRQL